MRALVWFTNDLRIDDNPTLSCAHNEASAVVHAIFIADLLRAPSMPGLKGVSSNRQRFLAEGINDLSQQLEQLGQQLVIINGSARKHLGCLISQYDIDAVYRTQQCASDELNQWTFFKSAYPDILFKSISSATLFHPSSLPFKTCQTPQQFTPFRKAIEKADIKPRQLAAEWRPAKLLAPIKKTATTKAPLLIASEGDSTPFCGGENIAQTHLSQYFSSLAALTYKNTRNQLDGFSSSTKFSPWLAQGSISAVAIYNALKTFEDHYGSNESTYWIYFELLWREFFFWTARNLGPQLFTKKGRLSSAPLTSFYPERFKAWTQGNTPWPLVNACMKELSATGYLSNRGRQIVASCLINELQLDWRYGAAYFEQQLIDYDPASNWGNWQYLAGVGADPRGQRHFNIEKQTALYDPEHTYITQWCKVRHHEETCQSTSIPLDSMDAADWPVESTISRANHFTRQPH